MKIAFYIEDGLEQIVLTPEADHEKAMLAKLHDGTRELTIKSGSFYECRGGWTRRGSDDTSTIVILRRKPEVKPTEGEIREMIGLPEFEEVN